MNAELRALGTGGGPAENLTNKFKELSTVGWGMKQVFAASLETIREVNEKGFQKNFTVMGRVANRVRLMTHGLKGFRMEALGVMFFGMMLANTFTGLLRPALDASGAFDLVRSTLED